MEYSHLDVVEMKSLIERGRNCQAELERFFKEAASKVFNQSYVHNIRFKFYDDRNVSIVAYTRFGGEEEELDTFITEMKNITTIDKFAKLWVQDLNNRETLRMLNEKKLEEERERLEVEREKDLLKELLEKHGNPNNDNPAPGEIPY